MSQTPYEIRLELLKMAKEIVELNWSAIKEKTMLDWNEAVEMAKHNNRHSVVQPIPTYPKIAPIEYSEIMAVAEQLNGFVSKR